MKASERQDRTAYYFDPIYEGRFEWDKISRIEKERPDHIEAIRSFRKTHSVGSSGVYSLFDYHRSWGFARILMSWSYHRNPLVFRELLKLCYDLIEPYPEIKINIHHGNIDFVTKSHYIKSDQLDKRFEMECEYPKRFIHHFPVEEWKKVSGILKENKKYIDSLRKARSFDTTLNFSIVDSPFVKISHDEKVEDNLSKEGVYGFVSFSLQCLKDNAVKVKNLLEQEGCKVKMTMRWPGDYYFAIYDFSKFCVNPRPMRAGSSH